MAKETEKRLLKTLECLKEPHGSSIPSLVKAVNHENPPLSLKRIVQTLRGCLESGILKVANGKVKLKDIGTHMDLNKEKGKDNMLDQFGGRPKSGCGKPNCPSNQKPGCQKPSQKPCQKPMSKPCPKPGSTKSCSKPSQKRSNQERSGDGRQDPNCQKVCKKPRSKGKSSKRSGKGKGKCGSSGKKRSMKKKQKKKCAKKSKAKRSSKKCPPKKKKTC